MEFVYWLLAIISLTMSVVLFAVKGKSDIWLSAFLGFLASYLGLIILDAQDFYISPRLYFIFLAIIYLPGPILLGYIAHISSRRLINISDFLICLLPILIVLVAPSVLSEKSITQFASRADYHNENYTALFNLITSTAGIYILAYIGLSINLLFKMRADWSSYQSQSLPDNWYKMLQVIIIILVVALLQVASSFIHIAGAKASIGDLSFIALVLYFIYQGIITVNNNQAGKVEDEVIIQQPEAILEIQPVEEPEIPSEIQQLGDKIKERLDHDQLFLQEELSLNTLAQQLDTSSHKLSIALNSLYKQTFYEFINDYRIKYAAQQLVDQPKTSITDIYFEAGFTTKSTFYSYFKKSYGCTPSQYRKQGPAKEEA